MQATMYEKVLDPPTAGDNKFYPANGLLFPLNQGCVFSLTFCCLLKSISTSCCVFKQVDKCVTKNYTPSYGWDLF